MSNTLLSVIVPFYNEKGNLFRLHQELISTLKLLKSKSEIIYVDDGSNDKSSLVLKKYLKKEAKITSKLVTLEHNSGQTAASLAGINSAGGKLICLLDADLQNDPKDILFMLKKINQGYDGVFGWRKNRKDKPLRILTSKIANSLIRIIFNPPFHDIACSLKVFKKEVFTNLKLYGQWHRILPLVLYWQGFKVTEVEVNHRERMSGRSKQGYLRIFNLIWDLVINRFSNKLTQSRT